MNDLKELKQLLSELNELMAGFPAEIIITDEFDCAEAADISLKLDRVIELLGYIQNDMPKLEKIIRRPDR